MGWAGAPQITEQIGTAQRDDSADESAEQSKQTRGRRQGSDATDDGKRRLRGCDIACDRCTDSALLRSV